MASTRVALFLLAATALASCQNKAETPAAPSSSASGAPAANDPIASAESAAPAAVAKAATVVTMGAEGKMATLRKGTNGWICLPDDKNTPGPDPMCMDANALEFMMATMAHKTPATDKPGVMYMLQGSNDASNTDPFAGQPAPGSDWQHTGPHMMVVGSSAALKGYPGGAHPDTTQPYIMFEGTPYAHLMIPVS